MFHYPLYWEWWFCNRSLSALKINFDSRFSAFNVIANENKIFQNPFNTDIESLASELQIEIIDLQSSDIIKNIYQNTYLSDRIDTIW